MSSRSHLPFLGLLVCWQAAALAQGDSVLGQGGASPTGPLALGLPAGRTPTIPPVGNFYRTQLQRWSANAWGLARWVLLEVEGGPAAKSRSRPTTTDPASMEAFYQEVETLTRTSIREQVNVDRAAEDPEGGPALLVRPQDDQAADLVSIGRALQRSASPAPKGVRPPDVPVLTLSSRLKDGASARAVTGFGSPELQAARRRYLAVLRAWRIPPAKGRRAERLVFQVYDPHQPATSTHRIASLLTDPEEGELGFSAGWAGEADQDSTNPAEAKGDQNFTWGTGAPVPVAVPDLGTEHFVRGRADQLGLAHSQGAWAGLKLHFVSDNGEEIKAARNREWAAAYRSKWYMENSEESTMTVGNLWEQREFSWAWLNKDWDAVRSSKADADTAKFAPKFETYLGGEPISGVFDRVEGIETTYRPPKLGP